MSGPLLALVGPTASGKTAVALEVAPALGAEIVCCDSMTIYRGMDLGTAKPGATARAAVPHHLLDVAEPQARFTVARFQRLARAALEDIRARGRTPMLVGGAGLYFRAVADDLALPPEDPTVRARLQAEDLGVLGLRLRETDPAAGFVDLANKRRVVRALEVIELTGRPFSSFRQDWERRNPVVVAGLRVEPDELAVRIDQRLRAMLDAGLLEEVRELLAAGYRDALTASQAVAYRDAISVIEGEIDEAAFLERAARATRRLARRQMSWFRSDPRVRWFDASDIARAAGEVRAYYGRATGERG